MTASASDPQPAGQLATAGLLAGPYIPAIPSGSDILTVGKGEMFATLGAAIAASHNGDVIEVQAGTYVNDFAEISTNIKIIGVGGMVNLVATEAPPNGKAILVTDANVEIDNVSFSGVTVPDGNGAGIRYEQGNLVLDNDYFFDNQDGLLSAPNQTGTITINQCEFANNGSGTGQTHNLYVGDIAQLTVENSYFTGAVVGHEIKSRAANTLILDNVIADGPTAPTSYSIDLPDGGQAVIQGNYIEKGPNAQNDTMIHFGGEGLPYAGSSLVVTGNTLVNDLQNSNATGLTNATGSVATISNNVVVGLSATQLAHGPYIATGNVDASGKPIANSSSTSLVNGATAMAFTDNAAHTVTMGSTLTAVAGGAGLLTVYAPVGHVTVIGGPGGLLFTDQTPSGGGDTIQTKAGSNNVLNNISGKDAVSSYGDDIINLGSGEPTVAIAGSATVNGGMGNYTLTITGTANVTDQGSNLINVNQGGVLNLKESDFAEVIETLGTANITYDGSSSAQTVAVTGGTAETVTRANGFQITTGYPGGPGAKVVLTSGDNTVISQGNDTITAGSGNDTVQVDGNASIQAGTGTLTVYGHGGSAAVYGGTASPANVAFNGDSGQLIRFVGGAQNDNLTIELSSVSITGGAGHLGITAANPVNVTGGSGGISLQDTAGADTVSTLAGATDAIAIAGGRNRQQREGHHHDRRAERREYLCDRQRHQRDHQDRRDRADHAQRRRQIHEQGGVGLPHHR